MNRDKKVRFAKPVTSSSNIPKQNNSLKTKDSNKPLLTSIGVNTITSASGSKPLWNIKNNRISRPPSSNEKNIVEEHPRNVNFSLNKSWLWHRRLSHLNFDYITSLGKQGLV
ncbi:retrovirus-related pol polyprotein from transposon TNT 1-94 [Tanacetum coccineum]